MTAKSTSVDKIRKKEEEDGVIKRMEAKFEQVRNSRDFLSLNNLVNSLDRLDAAGEDPFADKELETTDEMMTDEDVTESAEQPFQSLKGLAKLSGPMDILVESQPLTLLGETKPLPDEPFGKPLDEPLMLLLEDQMSPAVKQAVEAAAEKENKEGRLNDAITTNEILDTLRRMKQSALLAKEAAAAERLRKAQQGQTITDDDGILEIEDLVYNINTGDDSIAAVSDGNLVFDADDFLTARLFFYLRIKKDQLPPQVQRQIIELLNVRTLSV